MGRSAGAFIRVFRRELQRMTARRLYFGVCIVLPLFCLFFMATVFGNGQMENIPIGIVDLDRTATSRQIARTIATVPTWRVRVRYIDELRAREAMQRKDIYAYLVIPFRFESDLLSGRQTFLPYSYHYALLSVGVEIRSAMERVLAAVALGPVAAAGQASGAPEERIESFLLPVGMQAHPLYNPSLDYAVYLSHPFFFILLQILILLVTLYALGSEIKFGTADAWLRSAGMNIFAAVTGKLLPYTVLFILMGLLGNSVLFGFFRIPLDASIWPLNLTTALFVIATQALGLFLFSLFPALSIVISVASMVGSLGATLSGVTFPVESMYPFIRSMTYLLPVRHFVEINRTILYGDNGYAYAWQNVATLFLFLLPALIVLPHLKRATLSGNYVSID